MMPKSIKILAITLLILLGVYSFYTIPSVRRAMALAYTNTITNTLTLTRSQPLVAFTAASVEGSRGTSTGLADRIRTGLRRWLGIGDGGTTTVVQEQTTETAPTTTVIERVVERVVENPTAPTTIITTAGGADELWYQNLYNAVAGLRAELIPLIDLAMRRPLYESHSRKSSGSSNNSTPSGNYLPLAGGTLTGPVSGPDATFTDAAFTDATTDNLTINGTLTDGTSSAGANGYVLQSTGTGIEWVATSTLGLGGSDFSTTSADFWITTKSLEDLGDVSAMSQNTGDLLYWNGSAWANIATSSLNITQDLSGYFTLADWYATTTDALDEGNTNLYFTDQRVADYIVSSTTIANATPTDGNILLGNGTTWTSVGTSSLGIPGPDGDFSTTSADYWETQQTPRTADDLSDNSLEELQDVASMSQATGDLLYWNGSAWANIATSSLNITQDLSGYFTLADWYSTTTDALDEGNTNLYFTDQRVADYIASTTIPTATPTDGFVLLGNGVAWTAVSTSSLGFPGPDGDFSTTSADFWITTKSLEDLGDVSAMSQNTGDLLYWNGSAWANIATSSLNITQDLSGYFTLADWYATTTDALDEGNTNLYFTDQRVADYIVSSTTIANATPTDGNILLGNGTTWTSVGTSSLGISGNVNAGTTGQITYYAADGTTVSGTSSLFLKSDGTFGVGTTNPAEALDVDGNIKVNAGIGFGDLGAAFTAGGIYIARGLHEAVIPEAMNLGGHGGFTFSVNDVPGATSTPKMVIASDGKVGIGTTTPSAQLTIQGASAGTSAEAAPFALAVYGGEGGSPDSSPGYSGGGIVLVGGTGGSGQNAGGRGGDVTIAAGSGGSGNSYGDGGSVTIQAGNSSGWGTAGNIYFTPGTNPVTGNVFVTQGKLTVATSSSASATFYVAGNAAIGTGYNTTPPTNGLLVQGNVGIGTTTVSEKLHVDGNVVVSGTTTASCFTTDGTTCITGAGSGSGTVNSGTSGQFAYYASSGDAVSGSTLLTTDSGNIGIGTSTPSAKLTVAGTSLFTGNATFGAFASFNGDAIYNANVYLNSGLYDGTVSPGAAGYVLQSTGTSTQWVATSSLNVDGGGTVNAGTTGQVTYYAADGNTVSGTSSLFIASDGKIGIGTTTPSEKLHVEGNAIVTGNIGIGTSTPQASLHVIGDTIVSGTTTVSRLGIGTTTPSAPLTVDGYALITGGLVVESTALFDDATFGGDVGILGSLSDSGSSPGISGYLLQSTGTGIEWVATSSLGLGGGGGGSSKWTDGGSFIYPTDGEYISVPYIVSTSTATSTFAGNIVMSGSIIPSASGTYDLGSPSMPWSDVYISEASLYIDGQKVLQADNDNIVVSADINQSLIVKTTGVGDIELNPSGSGVIYMKGNTQFSGGKVISTSDNSVLEFEDGILAGNLNIDGNTITASNTDGSITLMPNGDGKILLSGGNVGIGTSTPSQKLHVQGNARITGALYDSTNAAGSNGYVLLSTGSGTQWVATSTLGLGGGGGSGTVNSGTTGQFAYYASDGTAVSGSTLLTTDSGNIGIGTSTPSAKLHVAGDARFEGALYDNTNSTGLAGYVLASTGSGVEWVATSTLGMEGGSGGGGIGPNGILPASMLYKPASPSALNCEFDDGVTGCPGWSFVGPHSNGTVDHTVQQTTFIRDTDTWPGWTLWQGDNQSAVSYAVAERTYTPASEEQWVFRPMSTGAVSATNEGRSALCYRNSGDSNENVCVGLHTAGSAERIEMYCINNGSLSVVGSISSRALSDSVVLGIQKNGDVYSGYVYPSDGGFSHPTNAMAFGSCTKTGNTTFDTIQYQVSTANETPSPITGVDFIRYYASRTFALLNPAPANAGAGIISAGLQGQVAYYADSGTTTLSGSSNLVIDTLGNVGVGTSTPSEKLHVEGNAIITGTTTASCFSTDGTTCITGGGGEFATTTADFWLDTKSLQDLGDVATMTATTGDLLYWNGSEWTNIATSSLGLGGGGGGGGSGTVNTATTGQFAYYAADGTAVSGQSVLTTDGTNIGIGTTTPGEKLDVWGNFRVGTSSTPLIFANTGTGMLGIGTASPSAKLHVVGSTRFEGGNFSVGGGGIFHNTLTNMTSIESLNLGNMSFDTDAGMVSWINLPISSTPAAGTVQSYSAQIDDNPLFTLYGEADGSGGAQNMRVGIGTTTPNALLALQGSAATSSTLLFNVASSSGASIFSIWGNATASTTAGGRVGVGMASSDVPLTTFEVRGLNEAPTTGSSTNGILGLFAEGITPELSMGVTAVDGVYTWIQGKHRTDPNTYYPVVINPNGGNVGIGTTTQASASSTLTVAGGVSLLDLPSVSSFPQDVLCITSEGVVQRNLGAGTCTSSSRRFKHGEKALEIGLTQLVQLRPVSFMYNNTEEERVGFMAEDVDEIEELKPFVFREEDGTPRGVRYEDMVALVVKAIQELNTKVETLLTAMAEGVVEFAGIIADNITTHRLCLDDVCITKYELQQLLDNANVDGAPQQPEEPEEPPVENPPVEPPIETPPVEPPTEPTEPTEPVDPEPTDPPTEPTEPEPPTEPTEPIDPEPTEPEPETPTEPTEPENPEGSENPETPVTP